MTAPIAGPLDEARFLIERLNEWERDLGEDTEVETAYIGHVHPSKERLRMLLASPLPAEAAVAAPPAIQVVTDEMVEAAVRSWLAAGGFGERAVPALMKPMRDALEAALHPEAASQPQEPAP